MEVANEVSHTSSNEVISASGTSVNGEVSTSFSTPETQRGQRQERRKDDDGKRDESRTSMGGTYTPKARRRDAAEELVDSKDSSNNEEKEVSGTTAGFKSGARSSALHVVLMGDSVLDDFHWLSDKKQDVRQQVGDRLLKLGSNHKCSNYAVDQSEIDDVLYGMVPPRAYVKSRKAHRLDPYPTDVDGLVYPLKLINRDPKPTHVILSIGGNDARAAFAHTFDLENIYTIMVDNGIVKRFEKLVSEIMKTAPNVVLVYVYHPKITMFPLLWGLPPASVIDYGTTPIEPSNKSGKYIADLIMTVIEDFKFGAEPSKAYYKPVGKKDIVVEEIDANWTPKVYQNQLKEHLQQCQDRSSSCVIS